MSPRGWVVFPALELQTCIKSFKMCLKSNFKEIDLKHATNGQSDKGFLLTSTFVPRGLSAPALGLYTCMKALKYIPGPGVRWAFTGPLVLWLLILRKNVCNRNGRQLNKKPKNNTQFGCLFKDIKFYFCYFRLQIWAILCHQRVPNNTLCGRCS